MHTTSSRTLILFTLVTMFGAAAVFSAPKPQKIKGDLDGTIVFTPPNVAAGIYGIKVECTGALSSFGRTQVVWEGSALLNSGLAVTPLPGVGWRLTTANGDTLKGPIEWQVQPESVPGVVYVLVGICQVNGGTGRYEGATGTGTARGTINVMTGKVSLRFEGSLVTVK